MSVTNVVLAGLGGQAYVFLEDAGLCDGDVAGEQVGQQAHVGCAAGVYVVAQERKADRIRIGAALQRTTRDSSAAMALEKLD